MWNSLGTDIATMSNRAQLLDPAADVTQILLDLHQTVEALGVVRGHVINLFRVGGGEMGRTPIRMRRPPVPLFDDFFNYMDPAELSRIRRKNRTCLDEAVLRCLLS